MKLNEYQEKAMTTCTESSNNDTYAFFQLSAECGELMDKVAKGRRKGIISIDENVIQPRHGRDPHKMLVNQEFADGVKKELGDVLWSVAQIAHRFGWSLEEVAQLNLDKLADRAKRNVIIGEGDNR
jgi:NTP pyrophosphatase (non-canonical NTP hydrolase)